MSGSGKTSLAGALACRLGIPHVELDSLFWEPGWREAELRTFRRRVDQATSGPAWVVDGNYQRSRDIVWPRADTFIWLDYPLSLALWRLLMRETRRILTRQVLWNGNRTPLRDQFGSNSLYAWAIRKHREHRVTYPEILTRPEYAHLCVLRFRSPWETEHFLRTQIQLT